VAPKPKLSVCIATFNRGSFIGETLESICRQKEAGVEIIVVDGASPDQTREVVAPYLSQYPELHYFREETNSGVDADYDKAVSYATGEYCWLMTDDDVLTHGAITRLLKVIEKRYDLIVVNSEVWNADFSQSLETRMLKLSEDREYRAGEADSVFADLATSLSFIGSVVIKRSVWLERDRSLYYGSLYGHVGVIFQHPPVEKVAVMADPLIRIRYGNSMWTPRRFEVLYFKWPAMIWSFSHVADWAKRQVVPREPWRRLRSLLKSRAIGEYSLVEFRKFLAGRPLDRHVIQAYLVSVFPAKVANAMWVVYYALFQRSALFTLFDLLHSRQSSMFSRSLAGLLGIKIL
jgi:abequosyltransferase